MENMTKKLIKKMTFVAMQSHWFDAGLFLVARMRACNFIYEERAANFHSLYCFVGIAVNKK